MEKMVWINGEPCHDISVMDRAVQYGDGLFETIAVIVGKPRQWQRHMARLTRGCAALQLPVPDLKQLLQEAQQLCREAPSRAVLKLIISRGGGGRGYRFPTKVAPTRILSRHPWPDYPAVHHQEGVMLTLCKTPLGLNPALAGVKHLNRLEQVLARNEWHGSDIQEGVMLDTQGHVIAGTMSNLFIVEGDTLITPDLSGCGVSGIMREMILELAQQLAIPTRIEVLELARLRAASACFVTNSLIGLWPVRRLDDINYAPGEITGEITQGLINALSQHH